MRQFKITTLHCTSCANDLVHRLEEASGLSGFTYDPVRQLLAVPDDSDFKKIEHILNADKIYILNHDENPTGENTSPLRAGFNPLLQKQSEEGSDDLARSGGESRDLRDAEHELEPYHEQSHDYHHDHGRGSHHANASDHEHGHSHGHGQGGHNHSIAGMAEKNILGVFFLNLIFSVIEFAAGLILNSTSIFSDAIHDFGDALSVGLAWIFEKVSMRHKNQEFTFGHRRFSLLGALITGTVLSVGSVVALARAVPRLIDPQPVDYSGMLWLSIAAILANGIAAYLLHGRTSKNESILNVHMMEDMLGWIGILLISVILHFRPWYILDPIASVAISLYILTEAVEHTVKTLRILLESVPEGIKISELEQGILAIEGVHGFSHLHVWSMDGEENNFAVTLFTDTAEVAEHSRIRRQVQTLVAPQGVQCSTVEIDYDPHRMILGKN